jgi:hypothetical protein
MKIYTTFFNLIESYTVSLRIWPQLRHLGLHFLFLSESVQQRHLVCIKYNIVTGAR